MGFILALTTICAMLGGSDAHGMRQFGGFQPQPIRFGHQFVPQQQRFAPQVIHPVPIPQARVPMPQVQAPVQAAPTGPTCDVGEQERVPGGLCSVGASTCDGYCRNKFGAEFVSSTCADRPGKSSRECICKLKCCNFGCWGDPHCYTCDGVKFGYQGLKKHYLFKPITKYQTLPYFEIRQINRVWGSGPMAVLDISELVIKDWGLVLELRTPNNENGQFQLLVNENTQSIPYRYSNFDDYREHYLSVSYLDASKRTVVLQTSFGLRINYAFTPKGALSYSDVSIFTPRHPELKDNSHGLLGRWNGNPDDDSVDAKGVKQKLDDAFSWAFGDSWIVPGGRTPTADCVRKEAEKAEEELKSDVDPKVQEAAEKTCKQTLEGQELINCATKIGRTIPLVKNCVTDLLHLESEEDRKWYIDDLVKTFQSRCNGGTVVTNDNDEIALAIEG